MYPQLSIISIMAQSVLLPCLMNLPVAVDFWGYASELNPTASPNKSKLNLLMNCLRDMMASLEKIWFSTHTDVTVMEFCVRVPVLSLRMLLAPPMISQLAKFFTKFCSSFILLTEKANAIVTASGRPYLVHMVYLIVPPVQPHK